MELSMGCGQSGLPCAKVFDETVVGTSMRGWADQRPKPKLSGYICDCYFCLKVECFCLQRNAIAFQRKTVSNQGLGKTMQARRFEQSEEANLDIVPFLLRLYGTGDNEMLKSRVRNMAQEKDE